MNNKSIDCVRYMLPDNVGHYAPSWKYVFPTFGTTKAWRMSGRDYTQYTRGIEKHEFGGNK